MATSTKKYFFTKFRSGYAIWTLDKENNGVRSYDKVFEHYDYETIVREMYRLNGWKQPAKVVKRY